MSAAPGWYPDPSGQPGLRYWDGSAWSATTRPTPPPGPLGQPGPRAPQAPQARSAPGPSNRRRAVLWTLGGVAVVAALVLLATLVIRQVGGLTGGNSPFGNPSSDVCPQSDNASPAPQPNDGRVHGGPLSFPQLGAPFGAPTAETRVPFGREVMEQYAEIERGPFLGFTSWGSMVLVGELVAGDGFFAPKDGAAIVMTCVTGTFYGDTEVTRDDRKNSALRVDGHDGWILESNLGFDVPNLKAKHELLIVVVVDVGDGTAGLFSASIPENAPQHVPLARRALAELKVEK